MKETFDNKLELCREKSGLFASKNGDKHGRFFIPTYGGQKLCVLSSGELDSEWEHVSVSTIKRCPNWNEMCMVKDLFWDDNECVIQFHPPKSEYVNNHPYCLHLWKSRTFNHVTPPSINLGLKQLNIS